MSDTDQETSVLERAFAIMEVDPPASFDDDSPKANYAKNRYQLAIDLTLEGYDWSDARRVAGLAKLASLPAGETADPELTDAWALPDDLVRMRHVYDGKEFRWRKDGRVLLSEPRDTMMIRYTHREIRVKFMPASFREVAAHHLAVLLSPKYVKSKTKKQEVKSDLRDAIAAAQIFDQHTASAERIDDREYVDWAEEAVCG
ncbi:MAG: hypothetical protein AAF582_00145 [Pseudomonadota bacterium]